MKLYYSHSSPFVRKILVTARKKNLENKIELIDLMVNGVYTPTPEFKKHNPLAKIPTLLLDNNEAMIDSPIICEYLNGLSDTGSIFPKDRAQYFQQKKIEAVADGATDAAVLRRYEQLRPENLRSADWDNKQKEKIALSYQYLESVADTLQTENFYIGEISTIAMIDYIDYRFPDEKWLAETPKLKKWYDQASKSPLFAGTEPKK
jgi:glutathione S-transferase